jgi:hypothetical protein
MHAVLDAIHVDGITINNPYLRTCACFRYSNQQLENESN